MPLFSGSGFGGGYCWDTLYPAPGRGVDELAVEVVVDMLMIS